MKNLTQQDLQSLHRLREQTVKEITAQVNMLRGLLLEYGVAIPDGIARFRNEFHQRLESHRGQLSGMMYGEFIERFSDYQRLRAALG